MRSGDAGKPNNPAPHASNRSGYGASSHRANRGRSDLRCDLGPDNDVRNTGRDHRPHAR